jgi:hypothetical protein
VVLVAQVTIQPVRMVPVPVPVVVVVQLQIYMDVEVEVVSLHTDLLPELGQEVLVAQQSLHLVREVEQLLLFLLVVQMVVLE